MRYKIQRELYHSTRRHNVACATTSRANRASARKSRSDFPTRDATRSQPPDRTPERARGAPGFAGGRPNASSPFLHILPTPPSRLRR
ncbi:hypothetical protein RZS08_10020 [Arthrospira platensis SPKY1]|nr:hypothetical protein [Arthrospira platensis SPKY1]